MPTLQQENAARAIARGMSLTILIGLGSASAAIGALLLLLVAVNTESPDFVGTGLWAVWLSGIGLSLLLTAWVVVMITGAIGRAAVYIRDGIVLGE